MKAGWRRPTQRAPIYSHLVYDVMPNHSVEIDRPDILIVEGLNVLQAGRLPKDGEAIPFVSDFFDFSIYLDADEEVLKTSGTSSASRRCASTAFSDPKSYFHRYVQARPTTEAVTTATDIWNAHQPGQPARKRAADTPARRPHPHQRREPRRPGEVALRSSCEPLEGEIHPSFRGERSEARNPVASRINSVADDYPGSRAARLARDNARVCYAYAVALRPVTPKCPM